MKIDKFELQKQRKEEILEGEHFVRLEIIIPKVTTFDKGVEPIVELHTKSQNAVMMWCLYNLLDSLKETLIKKDPNIKLTEMIMGTKIVDMGSAEKGDVIEVQD